MKKFILLFCLAFVLITANAQHAEIVITSHDPVPDPLTFCIGESLTMEVQKINTANYESFGDWLKCSEEPDLEDFSNFNKWEWLGHYDTSYTFDLSEEVYFFAKIHDLNFGYYTPVIHISTKGIVPALVYTEADTAFCSGSTVAISVDPSDLGDGNYMWFKDSVEITGETTANYTISESGLYHVEAKDVNGDCPDNFISSSVVEFTLIQPAIYGDLKMDLNRMSFSTDDIYVSYQWYSGADEASLAVINGATNANYDATISGTDTYYAVEVETTGGCTAMSEAILVNNIIYSTPVIATPASTFACRDESIELTVENDVYASYQWYKNGNSINNANTPSITVDESYNYRTGSYTVIVTTVLDETDEFESAAIDIEIAEQPKINVLDNATFCPDANVGLYSDDKFDTYQWLINDINDISTAVEIADATDSSTVITIGDEPRYYFLKTTYNSCEDVSSSKYVNAYSLNAPSIYTSTYGSVGKMCMGDSVGLKGGGYDVTWQWYLNGNAVEGMTEKNPYAKEVGSYTLEITSTKCPEMDPVMSKNAVEIKYSVLPKFTVDPTGEIVNNNPNHIVFCTYETISLSVENSANYENWQWIGKLYDPASTSDDWEEIEGQTNSEYTFINGVENNKLHFKVRVDSLMGDGTYCTGVSEYKTIDAWVFLNPTVASYNTELCEQGDSVLLHLGFPGTWVKYAWELDGNVVPNSNNDTIWAKEPGEYVITAYPEDCPSIKFSSGIGPIVNFMPDAEILGNDTLIYAKPFFGSYNHQWYYSETDPGYNDYINNMQALNMDTIETPWIIYFNQMKPGYYAVEIINDAQCLRISDVYSYNTTGIDDFESSDIKIYPNPVTNTLNVSLSDTKKVKSVEIYNVTGILVDKTIDIDTTMQIPMEEYENGVYIIKVNFLDNNSKSFRIIKN